MDKLQMVVDFLKKLNINFSQYLQASQIPEIRSNPEIADFYADDLLQNVAEDMEKHEGVSRNSFFKSFEKYKASQMGNNSVNEGKKQVKYRLTESQFKNFLSDTTKKILKEYTDSLGQYHGSLMFNHDRDFAKHIFALMNEIESIMDTYTGEEDDYNEQQAYIYLKKAYNALHDLVYLEASDY